MFLWFWAWFNMLQINPLCSLTNWVDSRKWVQNPNYICCMNSPWDSVMNYPKPPVVCFFLSAAIKKDGSKDKPGSFPCHLNLLPNWTGRNGSCTLKASWGTRFGHHTLSCFQLESLSNALKQGALNTSYGFRNCPGLSLRDLNRVQFKIPSNPSSWATSTKYLEFMLELLLNPLSDVGEGDLPFS